MSGLESIIKEARDAPYKKPIKAFVYGISPICSYRKADGEERQMVTLDLADKHSAVKGILYDTSKLSQIREGSTYLILNSITKKEPTPSVVITKMTKMCKTGSIADSVPEDIRQRASTFAHPPQQRPRLSHKLRPHQAKCCQLFKDRSLWYLFLLNFAKLFKLYNLNQCLCLQALNSKISLIHSLLSDLLKILMDKFYVPLWQVRRKRLSHLLNPLISTL